MKRRAAPAFAGWMVEHLVPGDRSDGLAGDLLEQLAAGRTSRWYWRQAVAAVASGWFALLNDQRPLLILALLWSSLAPAWTACFNRLQDGALAYAETWRMDTPWSSVSAFSLWMVLNLLFIWTPIFLCLIPNTWISRSISRRRFRLALLLTAFVFFAGYFVEWVLFMVFSWPGPAIPGHSFTPTAELTDVRTWALMLRIPYFLSVLCALWTTQVPTAAGPCEEAVPQPRSLTGHRERVLPADPSRFNLVGLPGLLVSGFVSALFACLLLCRMPGIHGVVNAKLVVEALVYVGMAALAGAGGTALYWNSSDSPFTSNPPLSFDRFALVTAASWVWVPVAFLLVVHHSPAAPFAIALGAASLAAGLRGAIPEPIIPEAPVKGMFEGALRTGCRDWNGLLIAVCVATAAWAFSRGLSLPAAIPLATAGFVFAWKYRIAPADSADNAQVIRRDLVKLCGTAMTAVLVTLAVMVFGFAGRGYRLAGVPDSKSTVPNQARRAQARQALSKSSGYQSIILWPLPQKNEPVSPPPEHEQLLVPDTAHPLIIRFDGPYWYFQSPHRQPSSKAHQAHGTPVDYRIEASGGQLTMEAHQFLNGRIPLSDCREIQMTVANRNNAPGTISLAMLLTNSELRGKPAVYLGQQPVVSTEPAHFSFKSAPVTEVLRFSVPDKARLRTFNEITVMFLPERGRSYLAPEIAIQQFALFSR